MKHRESGKRIDSFKCYQKLEEDIAFVLENGGTDFQETQKIRGRLLKGMLQEFDEGRSKSYYYIAASIMETGELEEALAKAIRNSNGLAITDKSRILHSILDEIAEQKNYYLKLRR